MALDFFAGCVGGLTGVIVGHPLDTVKVRIQMQSGDNLKYRGTFHCLSEIARQESIAGLYKGITSPLVGVAAVNAMIFGVYGLLRPLVHGEPGNDRLWAHFAAGSVSGAVQSVITSPMELVKTRMQINESGNQSSWSVLKGIYQKEGGLRRGVFKGWAITLGREVPAFGTYFATYEALTSKSGREVTTAGMMLAGGMAGVASWIVCFPMDVAKTRFQSDTTGKYRGALDCIRKTYAAEGLKPFSRGLSSAAIRAFPTNAATFTVVTWIMRLADQRQNSNDLQERSKLRFETAWLDWDALQVQTQLLNSVPLNSSYRFEYVASTSENASQLPVFNLGPTTVNPANYLQLLDPSASSIGGRNSSNDTLIMEDEKKFRIVGAVKEAEALRRVEESTKPSHRTRPFPPQEENLVAEIIDAPIHPLGEDDEKVEVSAALKAWFSELAALRSHCCCLDDCVCFA